MDMSGRTSRETKARDFVDARLLAHKTAAEDATDAVWIPHDDASTFLWTRTEVDGQLGSWRITGMTLYGEITGERLRAIRMTGDSGPKFYLDASAFALLDRPHSQLELEEIAQVVAKADVTAIRDFPLDWEPRKPGETADVFYRRVALYFRELEFTRPDDPTQALAELADVPFTTAVHWVRVCRDRGILPKSKRQMKGQSRG